MPILRYAIVSTAQHVHYPIARLIFTSCSIPCFKSHKETHANDVQEQKPSTQANTPSVVPAPAPPPPTARQSTQKPNFADFETDPDLARLMTRYPNLRIQLQSVYGLTLEPPPQERPERQQFHRGRGGWRGRGRGRGFGHQQQQRPSQWTQAKGDKEAHDSFKKMRDAEGDTDGLAEFVQLLKMRFTPDQAENMT